MLLRCEDLLVPLAPFTFSSFLAMVAPASTVCQISSGENSTLLHPGAGSITWAREGRVQRVPGLPPLSLPARISAGENSTLLHPEAGSTTIDRVGSELAHFCRKINSGTQQGEPAGTSPARSLFFSNLRRGQSPMLWWGGDCRWSLRC